MDQLSLLDDNPQVSLRGCSDCVCRDCLYWWSSRCPYGECYDDLRAKERPYPHGERRTWTDWSCPGEQAHWCRGGATYPIAICGMYRRLCETQVQVQECLKQNVVKFQDGYIQCGLVDTVGCERCYEEFIGKLKIK